MLNFIKKNWGLILLLVIACLCFTGCTGFVVEGPNRFFGCYSDLDQDWFMMPLAFMGFLTVLAFFNNCSFGTILVFLSIMFVIA